MTHGNLLFGEISSCRFRRCREDLLAIVSSYLCKMSKRVNRLQRAAPTRGVGVLQINIILCYNYGDAHSCDGNSQPYRLVYRSIFGSCQIASLIAFSQIIGGRSEILSRINRRVLLNNKREKRVACIMHREQWPRMIGSREPDRRRGNAGRQVCDNTLCWVVRVSPFWKLHWETYFRIAMSSHFNFRKKKWSIVFSARCVEVKNITSLVHVKYERECKLG